MSSTSEFIILHHLVYKNISSKYCLPLRNLNVSVCAAGVWGSAFSILINRVLGVKEASSSSTMEEELGE